MTFNRAEKAVLTGFLLAALLSFVGFADTCDALDDNVLRLHILAESDSAEDQRVKLAVRDRLLAESDFLFADAVDCPSAKAAATEKLPQIRLLVADELKKQGATYSFTVEIVESMYFEQREYENFTMPAGEYAALRIVLGKGEGHNWWCVMFPPLCTSAACKTEAIPAKQNKVISQNGKYEIKFKVYEWISRLLH